MPYKVFNTSVNGVLVLEPKIFGDARGFFFESFNARDFQQATGLQKNFVQDNHSKSDKGVLRGLHYQLEQPQGKLVRAIEGAVFDVVVDIRKNSTTFGRWFGIELSSMNKNSCGYQRGWHMVSWLSLIPLSSYTRQPIITIRSRSKVCFGMTLTFLSIGLYICWIRHRG